MVSCHSCYIFGTWKSKEEVGGFNVIIWGQATKNATIFYGRS